MSRKHTPGPLVARRINEETRPFAVINPNGPHGDEIVAGYLSEADALLYASAPDLLADNDRLKAVNKELLQRILVVAELRAALQQEQTDGKA